ncbi:MAG TPA: hypothetical protein VE961_09150, partial [Pyrinomonadaceae bacterium]|nr:hypothetical protein [Pyrinomonadaceae bacterium]
KRTQRRYPGGSATPLQDEASAKRYRTPEGEVVIELRGNRVTVVEGIAESAEAKLLKLLNS